MKKYIAGILCLILVLVKLPVLAIPDKGVSAMGNFQGRLLTAGYDVTYDLVLHNPAATQQAVLVVLAEYAGNRLQKAVPEMVTLETGERFSKSYILSDITEDITSVRAFVLNSSDSVQPLIRADELNHEYASIYNDYAISNTISKVTEGVLTDEEVADQFPVHEAFRTTWQKYVVNGGSMLAYFETAPKKIYVGLSHRVNSSKDPVKFEQFRTARVIDPNGKVVCYYDFSAENASDGVIFDVPEYTGKPGIWTISYVGGLYTCDEVTIGIPETPYYGLRGEMLLGLNHKTMMDTNDNVKKWYMYVPESCVGADAVFIVPNNKANVLPKITKADGSEIPELLKANGSSADIESRLHSRALCGLVEEEDADTVWTLSYDNWMTTFGKPGKVNDENYWPVSGQVAFNGLYIGVVEGLPGLLCNSKEAAEKLNGGIAISSDGRTLGGTLQANARNLSLDIANHGTLAVTAEFPDEIPEFLKQSGMLGVEALTIGENSGIVGIQEAINKQNVNPNDLFLGSLTVTEYEATNKLSHRDNFEDFTYTDSYRDYWTTATLASYATLPTKLNGAYGDTGLLNRASLALLSHLVEMSPEHLLRGYGITYPITRDEQGNITNTSYGDYWPCERSLFTFPNLVQAYNLLKEKVSPEVSEIMRNGIILIGDKLANYMANDTNQWTEFIMGLLEIYMATGEERFLHYFERAVTALGTPPVDVNSLGQNSAGAYLERMAPSALYGNIANHNLLPCYYNYRSLANRDEQVMETLESIIGRYVNWESLNWMPASSGGSIFSATAIMEKGYNGSYGLGGGEYPNTAYSSVNFPVVNSLYQMRKDQISGSISADLLYRLPEVGETLLQEYLIESPNPLNGGLKSTYSGTRSYQIFTQEPWTEETATLPVYETDKVWLYDELLAWKKNGVYNMTFYSNPYSTSANNLDINSQAYRGGLPFAVWSEGTGPVVLSQHVNISNIAFAGNETTYYSGVHVVMADGTEHNTRAVNCVVTEQNSQGYTIVSPICHHTSNGSGTYGSVTYKTIYTNTGFTIDVEYAPTEAAAGYKEAYIQLPIFSTRSGSYTTSTDQGSVNSVISQSADRKTLNYKSTLLGSYGSMNIHSSTAATFDQTKGYGNFAWNIVQNLVIPLDENGKATITFEVVKG